MLDEMVKLLAKELGIDEIPKAELPGVYALPLEENVTIFISPIPEGGFSLRCKLIECPTKNKEQFLTHMMNENLFGVGTKGSSLGLDESGTNIVLTQNVDYTTDKETFLQIIEDFINIVDLWRNEAMEHSGMKIADKTDK